MLQTEGVHTYDTKAELRMIRYILVPCETTHDVYEYDDYKVVLDRKSKTVTVTRGMPLLELYNYKAACHVLRSVGGDPSNLKDPATLISKAIALNPDAALMFAREMAALSNPTVESINERYATT